MAGFSKMLKKEGAVKLPRVMGEHTIACELTGEDTLEETPYTIISRKLVIIVFVIVLIIKAESIGDNPVMRLNIIRRHLERAMASFDGRAGQTFHSSHRSI